MVWNLEAGGDAEPLEGVLLIGTFPMPCSALFLVEPRTILPRGSSAHISLKLFCSSIYSLILLRHFLT